MTLKLARPVTGRHKTVSFWDSFHGAGFAAARVGGHALFRRVPLARCFLATEHVAPFACYASWVPAIPACRWDESSARLRALAQQHGGGHDAAMARGKVADGRRWFPPLAKHTCN